MSRRPPRRPVRALTLALSVVWARLRHAPLRTVLSALRPPSARAQELPDAGDLPSGRPSAVRVPPPGRPLRPVPGRVLHLVPEGLPHRHTEPALRTQALARAQSAAGLDPHVVTRIGFPVAQGVLDARPLDLLEGVPHHRLLPRRLPHGSGRVLARNAELAGRLVERLRPSVLHAAGGQGEGRVALALREAYGLPVVHEVRDFPEESWLARAPGRSRSDETYGALREWETHCMRQADAVLTLGEAMKAEIVSRGVPPQRVRVAPHAVDPLFLIPPPDGGALRLGLGIDPEDYVVGAIGALTRAAGTRTLLEAVAELRRRGVPVRLLLVGDGPERRALAAAGRQLGLADGVVLFTGAVPPGRVRAYHGVLDVLALPRTGDRVCHLVPPREPVEAMASGLPVLASDLTAVRELVEHRVSGLLVPPQAPTAWADALEGLFHSPERRRAWGAAGRASVARDRTWTRVAATTRAAYHALGCL
ncbi:glycosyltransferase family 4 protein [Streptomyces sp. NPDC048664]|uniref:glycosyltransferase family 4 protein n=1 Tax=Streptomyces sp. NPDC048664 TaxID=3154505 RepID=UPI003441AFEA